jgi:plastocyanin
MELLRILVPVMLFTSVSVACSDEPEAPPPCEDPVTADTATMGELYFEPACLQASNGDTIRIVNDGDVIHTYTVRGTDVEANLEGGGEGDLTIEGLTAGTVYEVVCIYHSDMKAALKVV